MGLLYDIAVWIDDHNGFVIAILTFVMVTFNFVLLLENRKLRKMGNEPNLVVYIRPDKEVNFLNLYLSNIGFGPAFNIRFKISQADKIIEKYKVNLPGYNSICKIETLPQGEEIMTYFGNYMDWHEYRPLPKIEITIQYENIFGITKENKSIIDLSSFEGMVIIGPSTEKAISQSLKEISETLKNFKI